MEHRTCHLWLSGLWHHVISQVATNILEECIDHLCLQGIQEAVYFSKVLVTTPHLNQHIYCHDNLRPREMNMIKFYGHTAKSTQSSWIILIGRWCKQPQDKCCGRYYRLFIIFNTVRYMTKCILLQKSPKFMSTSHLSLLPDIHTL
jgi:hypothetical protein